MFSNATDAGTCTVTIAGKASGKEDHDYAYRSKTVTFKINPVDLETANVTWSKSAFEYTGEAIVAPTATVYRTGTTKYTTAAAQTEVKYYDANGEEVAADNIKEAGKYTAVLSGLEVEGTDGKQHLNYANSNTLTFYVGAESIDINDTTEDSAVKLGETLQLSSEINEESVYVAGTPEWKSSDESVATVDQTGLVTPLKAGLTTISVSAGGQTATFNISVGNNVLRECSIDWADTEHTYNGAEQTTSATVVDKNSGAKLVEGKDYVITYENNVNVGTATATITGIGDYAGTYSNTFQIEKADLSNLDAMLEYEVATYTGERLEPEVTIEGLEEGVDFEVTYSNCISKGNAYLFVKGIGNYSGRIFKTYAIEQANIVTAEVSGIAESYVYTGSKITPEIVVTWNGQTLAQKKDYGINMLNNSAIGTATVLIMGLGNFEGAQIVQFEIVAADDANDNTVGGSDSAGSGSTEGSGSNGGSDSTGSNGGSSDSSNSADTSAGSGSTSGSGSSSTTGSGVTDTSSSTTTTTPSTATTTSASTGSTESSSVDTSYVAASGSSVSISGASSSSAGSSTDSLSASSNGDVSGDDSTSSSLTVVSAVTALADAADDADASAKSSGTTTSSTDSGFNNYTSSSSSDGSQAEEGNDIAPAVAALVIFLVVAAGLGGFFLVRYLGARKAAEAAATASAAGSVGSAK
jgi:hypothetical protein